VSKEKKRSNLSLKTGLIPLSGVVLGFLVAVLMSLYISQYYIEKKHQDQLADQVADDLQLRINQRQARLTRQINHIATNIRLSNLVARDDPEERSTEEARLAQMMPNAIKIRLFKKGQAKVERSIDPPFTFASLDIINRVEQGEVVFLEAIKVNGNWLVSLAAPIKMPSEATIHGSIFVYLDANVFRSQLSEELRGQVRIIQSFPNTPDMEFLSLGASGSDVQISRTLNNHHWKIVYSPPGDFPRITDTRFPLILVPAIAAFVIALGAVLLGLQNTLKGLRSDTAHLRDQMTDVTSGIFLPSDAYQFNEFLELDTHLSKMGRRTKASQKAAPQPETTNQKSDVEIEMSDDETFVIDEDEIFEDEEAVFEEDDAFSGEEKSEEEESAEEEPVEEEPDEEDEKTVDITGIFRAYDIRGVVGETLTNKVVRKIGLAIGTEAGELGQQTLVVGADGRLSSPELLSSLIKGLIASGRDVVDLGFVPTPVLYYATHNLETTSGVMITGSHNPAEYNGLKVVLDGKTLTADGIQKLYNRYLSEDFSSGEGQLSEMDIREDYINAITDDVVVAQPLKVVVDCGNGIGGDYAPELLSSLGCEVIPLYCEVDGNFPNHHPDPIDPANLEDLILTVKSQDADIGLALDGDADRLVAVTKEGHVIWPDRLLMLFSKDVVSRNPGSDVVYDVKCTRHLNSVISGFGGRPIICRSGHSFIKEKMKETDAMLGGEMSGHICFKERWFGFDDGLYAAARLLEIVGSQSGGLAQLIGEFPVSFTTPEIQIPVPDLVKFKIIEKLMNDTSGLEEATITTIDGLRVDFTDSWGLVRASNTNPCLTLRFEADDERSLDRIQDLFREKLASINKNLSF